MDSINKWLGKDKISEAAILIDEIFDNEDDGLAFLDLTLARFEHFDESNGVERDKTFSNDVIYILQSSMASLTSKNVDKFENRIDSYFYIYRRLQEYWTMKKSSLFGGGSSTTTLEMFREKLYEILSRTFVSSKGAKPNLGSSDKDLLQRINIRQHLSSIKTIDMHTQHLFFALCKLSMQSSLSSDRLKWVDILSKIETIKLSLENFINQYLEYTNAFEQFPLDTPAYIYLIQKIPPLKQHSISPFSIIFPLCRKLRLPPKEFFDSFLPLFIKGVKEKRYETTHVSELCKSLSINEYWFDKYISNYSSNVNNDELWNMFLHLCAISEINDIIKKHLIAILTTRISTVSMETFHRYTQLTKECLTKIKPELHSHLIEIFEKIYDGLVITQIQDPQYSYRFTRTDLNDLLKIGLQLTSTRSIKRPSCLLLIREILFKIDNRVRNTAAKIKSLFQNCNNFDENLCTTENPIEIIGDEWLKDFLITNSQIWLKLDQDTYKYLCNHHNNNRWIIHIWTRIVHLSLLKLINENLNDLLVKLNEWIKNVKHDTYDSTDTLTTIFVVKVFELVIVRYTNSILSLPNIDIIMNLIISIRENQPHKIDTGQVNSIIRKGREILVQIFQLKGSYVMYHELLKGSILYSFLRYIDLKKILTSFNPQYYKLPVTTSKIDLIISLPKPENIDIRNLELNDEVFSQFIQQINQWFRYFERFIDIFQHIIEWLKNYHVLGTNQLYHDIQIIRNDPKRTLIQMKIVVDNALKVLQPITDLRRLCHLFNCLTSFRIIDPGTLNTQDNTIKFIGDLKRFQPNNTFTVERRTKYEHPVSITDRQQVQWSLASENHSCDIEITYQKEILFQKDNISFHKHILSGQFENQQNGQLTLTVNNKQNNNPCKVWYRIKSIGLSPCHLFHGIFEIFYEKYYQERFITIREEELSQLLDQVFLFIDKLLNGSLNLREMQDLRNLFFDKNIHIQEEVKKLYTNRSNEQQIEFNQSHEKEIEQVCEWLQIYQYYSHINIILECIEKFDLLSLNDEDETIAHLRRLGGNENCSLREITEAYKILQQRFHNLTHQHLQLIKTAVECSNVIFMMKKSDLYSDHGRRRFLELRDNLTTQFQLQEKNNMILNSWIMTYTFIEPFIYKATNFDEFILRLTQLSNLEESSLNHIKIVNDDLQIVNMWLSAEETTVIDNALITMEHLYKNGTVDIYLRHLMNEQSYFEIKYSIDRIQGQILNNNEPRREVEKIKFILSMGEIDDHKRQLTFCNVDKQQNVIYKKALIDGQLKLLQTIEKIYAILLKLELAGHPDYQLRENHYEMNLQLSQNNSITSEVRNHQTIQLENTIKNKLHGLQSIANTLQASYDVWIGNLKTYRQQCSLLKLFSNRQIMFLIIFLRTSNAPDSIRTRFLKNLFSFKDVTHQNDEEQNLTIQCLIHYLRSLRINQGDLSSTHILNLYTIHQIESGSNADLCLKKLSQFLKDLFHNEQDLFGGNIPEKNNQQYLVTLNPIAEKIILEHNFDMNTCCILLNIFNNRLPSSYQILWCANVTDEDIHLFFSRIRTFQNLIFVIMDIDQMHHRLREVLLNEQDSLARGQGVGHGTVYYFSRELTTGRKGLREFQIPTTYRNPQQTHAQLMTLFRKRQWTLPQIQIICGTAGIGKTHRINTQYKDRTLSCFSINDKLNLSLLISSFLCFDWNFINENPIIYFNISIHAPFEALNRTLFSLFICGSLNDTNSGLTFSLPITKPWKFVIEIPYSDIRHLTIKENFDQILPLLSIISSSSSLEEVTSDNYQLAIREEEELVARFLKAYENGTINRLSNGIVEEVKFDPIINPEECRLQIYNCINKYAPELPRNKIYELSFTKFLYRRVQFFVGHYYRFNQTIEQLGSIAMRQMIDEAKALSQINFEDNNYPRVYLVYDPYFSLHLLHVDWNLVTSELKSLFANRDPLKSLEYQHKDYFAECLAWLINIRYEIFMKAIEESKFILTENFAYKLFHVHERKLTKLALIIEGDTGVGKTFLLKFYSLLLNLTNAKHPMENNITPRFIENSSLFLHRILNTTVEKQVNSLNTFLVQMKSKILELENEDENTIPPNLPATLPTVNQEATPADTELFKEIKLSLLNYKYNTKILYQIWKTLLTVSSENAMDTTLILIQALHDYITTELANYPLIEASSHLKQLLQKTYSPTADMSIEIFKEFLFNSQIKPLFYRLLLHPGITEEQLVDFMSPISQLARELAHIEIVVFFDEVNTSSCLGLFKEMFMDGTLHGRNIPKNIFFTAAINPLIKIEDNQQVHRRDFLVHELPQSLEHLKVSYGALESRTLADYIAKKIALFQSHSTTNSGGKSIPSDSYFHDTLANSILNAQEFCEKHLGRNSVSQREIQRCFNLIEFFWTLRYDDEMANDDKFSNRDSTRCIALSLALIYYFRLPTTEDNLQRDDNKTPSRERLASILSQTIPDFEQVVQEELVRFVNTQNFVIPQGVAINQAVREHIFSIIVSIVTRTPLCIIGVPGQSKTLSFQIVLQNLQGAQLSPKKFCKRLPALDPFFCLGSKYSRSEDIAYIFERATKREQQYEQNRMNTRCVVFLDEASLPDEKKMVLKVLHPYLDECKVAFVAVANKAFDAANANRMICIYRSLPSEGDQKILAYGCLGLQTEQGRRTIDPRLDMIIYGLCQGYRRILQSLDIPQIFHDRDFIYMLRELRFQLANINESQETSIGEITPRSLLRALEDNFNGIKHEEFNKLTDIFFTAVSEKCSNFRLLLPDKEEIQRNIPTILRESMKLDPIRRRLYGRYKLIIDESEDESAVRLLFQSGILDSDSTRTTVFRMPDFPDDIDNELRNVEILSTIKLHMETGQTILMVNTGRIHGSLYDVFNQNFSIMATDETRKIFSKVAIGPKTIDVVVHEDFQCLVHIKRSEFQDIPAPFLSRFQKYSLSVIDFYHIELQHIPANEQILMKNVEEKVLSFIQHFGEQYFYGLNSNTLYSCLFSLIKRKENGECYLSDTHRNYTQITLKSKSFIEQNPTDVQQCLLFSMISKLLQLVSPEAMIYKLPTFEDQFARLLCQNYFYQQEHFHIENFLQRLISTPAIDVDNNDLFTATEDLEQKLKEIFITRKMMLFTRTSSFVVGLNEQSKNDLFKNNDEYENISEKIDVLNLAIIENSGQLQEHFQHYEQEKNKKVLIIIIDARISQQYLHIPFVRQLIDNSCETTNRLTPKFFLILLHSSGQELNPQFGFPSIFLHDWDYYFLDTGTPGSAFHLQKMLQIFTSSFGKQPNQTQQESLDHVLCDFNLLFEDCLWDFCSRIQIFVHQLPKEMFKNKSAYEFYQSQTSAIRRVDCLKELLQQSTQLQKRIVTNYHEHVSMNRESLQKTCQSIYQISKDILCGKRFRSLVDSFQSEIRISFANFVSNFLKFIVNDYGLETLSKLTTTANSYDSLLNLIDSSSFSTNSVDQTTPITQSNFSLRINYFFVPQTPLYNLFQERIKSLADDIKSTLVQKQNQYTDDLRQDYYAEPPTTTFNNYFDDNNEPGDYTSEQFQNELIKSLMNDKILPKILSQTILESYTNDSVRRLCTTIETNFNTNLHQCQKTIEFISDWLLCIDDNEKEYFDMSSNKHIRLLASVYTSIEYDQNDIFSLYSACRILERLDQTESFYAGLADNEQRTRSNIRENLFRLMFDHLWTKLLHLCSTNNSSETWIHSYTFISKYYPSEKVLQRLQLVQVKGQIEFMNLAYLILLNEKTPEPKELVLKLLQDTSLMQDNINGRKNTYETSVCLQLIPIIIKTIHQYFEDKNVNHSTLMIDIQQWIISTIKASNQSYRQEIISLFKFLNQPTCQLSLAMKQFLFDELANIYFESIKQNRIGLNKQNNDFWDRLCLLSVIVECLLDVDLQNYQIPYHPSIITNDNQKQILIDLFFFYLQRLANDGMIKCDLINKILLSKLPQINDRRLIPTADMIFKQLKDYFLLQITALLLCQSDLNHPNQQRLDRIVAAIISQYLSIDAELVQLNKHVQLFLAIILTKRSWNFLLNLLQSERFQRINAQWSNTLHSLFDTRQNPQGGTSLQLCHQLQFTLTTNTTLSIFPKLHQPYDELSKLIDQCIKNNDQQERWKPFSDWIQIQLTSNSAILNSTEIKVMLLLNIYYDYYCHNQLTSLHTLLGVIENTLQPSSEELRVFRAFLQPEQYMIGYPTGNENADKNELNRLFKLDCQDMNELNIRHSLVNLLAMILLSGQQNFLWTFTFEPPKLQNTFGFGSTRHDKIQSAGVHYDCGCLITENGDLVHFPNTKGNGGALSVPAVYIAYFSTFGAFCWHLLLYDTSTQDLYGHVLAKSAVDDPNVIYRIVGNSVRAKVCHFVRARLLSTYHFLSIHSNEDDACMLLNRCFEQMAQLTHPDTPWIKSVYPTFVEKFQAEQEYQNQIFYPIHQQLGEYKKLINSLYLQSQIQKNLQDYVSHMPVLIQFRHFKTELCNPKNIQLPLNILRNILDSFDFLRMTHFIYDLSQFYLLLHRTYAQLMEREEFSVITLKELHERSEKYLNNSHGLKYLNQNNKHLLIIQNGIKAVNAYHQFADGLIRPGACDETQRFATISIDTPIHYLVTTENYDEGDIIMRILSVLVDYHNNFLDLMERELEQNLANNGISLLKNLINELTSKEISILQIAQDNTGVITLNDNDCLWIEQLSRASLENEEYFPQLQTPKNFNFLYVQSYIIRSYLLFCRINHQHISQKYQFHISRKVNITTEDNDNIPNEYSDPEFEEEWNHLKEMNLDKLYNGYNLLRRINDLSKSSSDDLSKINLYEFIQNIDHQKEFLPQFEQYQIKNFPLIHIHHLCQLYEKSLNHFQHSFLNISHLLRIPIDTKLNEQLDQIFAQAFNPSDDTQDKEKLQFSIRKISDFLKDLKDYEDHLINRSAESLTQTCATLLIENSILTLIPTEIKCQNYVPLGIKLIEIKSKLHEKTIQIDEKDTNLWNEKFDVQETHQQTIFQRFKKQNFDLEPSEPEALLVPHTPQSAGPGNETNTLLIDFDDFPLIPHVPLSPMELSPSLPTRISLEKIDYTSLFELHIKSTPLTPSTLFDKILKQAEISSTSIQPLPFTMTYANGTRERYLCGTEKLYEQFRTIFEEQKYDFNQFVIIDKNQLLVDFINENNNTLTPYISLEYRVIERHLLFPVVLEFQEKEMEYLVTKETQISAIINRFIIDQQLQFTSFNIFLGFFDELGRYIEQDSSICDIYRSNVVRIKVIHYNNNPHQLSEVTLQPTEGESEMKFFDPTTKWEQIALWLQTLLRDMPINTYHFWNREQRNILDKHQSISSTLNDSLTITIDGIHEDAVMEIILSYEKNQQMIRILKSCPVFHLLYDSQYLQELNFKISPTDYVLVLVEDTDHKILSNEDIQQPVGSYSVADNRTRHFQISILIQLLQFDNQQELQILISNRNLTIKELLDLSKANDIYQYLAFIDTHMVLLNEEKLSNISQTKFSLVKEDQTCLISIERTRNLLIEIEEDKTLHQRYIINATIADIYKQNKSIIPDQYLVYENDFIPSEEISLTSFLPTTSPLEFTLTHRKFSANITVSNEEQPNSVQFYCSPSILIGRVCQIACQLFHLNKQFYRLTLSDHSNVNDDYSLEKIGESMDNIQFKLNSTADVQCQVVYGEKTILIPSNNDTLASTILKEALGKLLIPYDDIHMYKLCVMDDLECPRRIVLTSLMKDIRSLFPQDLIIIPFQLQKK